MRPGSEHRRWFDPLCPGHVITRVNTLKQKIANGQPTIGIWLSIPSPTVAEIAAAIGYDYIIIDSEHGQMGLETSIDILRAVMGSDTEALVRV
ncbi:MAG: hypothetical protein HOL85_12665, partial [Rhodospirillaceae bacterium]|nr:hypothetical protein [Rhodospirillaceae bacterium]